MPTYKTNFEERQIETIITAFLITLILILLIYTFSKTLYSNFKTSSSNFTTPPVTPFNTTFDKSLITIYKPIAQGYQNILYNSNDLEIKLKSTLSEAEKKQLQTQYNKLQALIKKYQAITEVYKKLSFELNLQYTPEKSVTYPSSTKPQSITEPEQIEESPYLSKSQILNIQKKYKPSPLPSPSPLQLPQDSLTLYNSFILRFIKYYPKYPEQTQNSLTNPKVQFFIKNLQTDYITLLHNEEVQTQLNQNIFKLLQIYNTLLLTDVSFPESQKSIEISLSLLNKLKAESETHKTQTAKLINSIYSRYTKFIK